MPLSRNINKQCMLGRGRGQTVVLKQAPKMAVQDESTKFNSYFDTYILSRNITDIFIIFIKQNKYSKSLNINSNLLKIRFSQ